MTKKKGKIKREGKRKKEISKKQKKKISKKREKKKRFSIWFKKKKKEKKKKEKAIKKKRKKGKRKEKVAKKGGKEKKKKKIKTKFFFGFINKFISFFKNIKTRNKNLEIEEEGKLEKKKEEYVDIFDILNEKRTEEEKEDYTSASNTLPVIKELLNDHKFPQLDDDARLEITKAISKIKMQNVQKNISDDKSAEENIRLFMNNLPTITELVKNLKQKEEEDIDDNRKEFRTRLREAANRINEKHKI